MVFSKARSKAAFCAAPAVVADIYSSRQYFKDPFDLYTESLTKTGMKANDCQRPMFKADESKRPPLKAKAKDSALFLMLFELSRLVV